MYIPLPYKAYLYSSSVQPRKNWIEKKEEKKTALEHIERFVKEKDGEVWSSQENGGGGELSATMRDMCQAQDQERESCSCIALCLPSPAE